MIHTKRHIRLPAFWKYLFFIIIIFIVGFFGIYYVNYYNANIFFSNEFYTYTNPEYGVSFYYPSNYTVSEFKTNWPQEMQNANTPVYPEFSITLSSKYKKFSFARANVEILITKALCSESLRYVAFIDKTPFREIAAPINNNTVAIKHYLVEYNMPSLGNFACINGTSYSYLMTIKLYGSDPRTNISAFIYNLEQRLGFMLSKIPYKKITSSIRLIPIQPRSELFTAYHVAKYPITFTVPKITTTGAPIIIKEIPGQQYTAVMVYTDPNQIDGYKYADVMFIVPVSVDTGLQQSIKDFLAKYGLNRYCISVYSAGNRISDLRNNLYDTICPPGVDEGQNIFPNLVYNPTYPNFFLYFKSYHMYPQFPGVNSNWWTDSITIGN